MPLPAPNATNTAIIDVTVDAWHSLIGPNGSGDVIKFSTLKTLTVTSPDLPGRPGKKLVTPDPANPQNIRMFGSGYLKFRFTEAVAVGAVEKLPRFHPVGLSYYRQDSAGKKEEFRRASDIASLPRDSISFGTDVSGIAGSPGLPFVMLWDNHGEVDANSTDTSAEWEYYLIIQDNFGSIGAIDPEIANENPD